MDSKDCLICSRIEMISAEANSYFVAELESGYVVIGDHQYFKGYTLFLCKEHKTELHFLDEDFKSIYMTEMTKVAEAVYNAFNPDKLNYELLGNGESHIHWHIFPRRENDMPIKGPVWWLDKNLMFSDEVKPNNFELKEMKTKLYNELKKITTIKRKGNY